MRKLIASLALALLITGSLPAQTFEQHFTEGEERMQEKKYKEALTAFDTALSRALKKDEKALALWRIGQAQKALGNNRLYLDKLRESLGEADIDEVRKELEEAGGPSTVAVVSANELRDVLFVKRKVDVSILFYPNQSVLTEIGERQIQQLAQALRDSALSAKRFQVVGHTDSTGSNELNQKLSEDRARSVVRQLVSLAIAPSRIAAEGRGETQLKIQPERTAEDRAANRRVEIRQVD